MRTQSNRAGLFEIIDRVRKLSQTTKQEQEEEEFNFEELEKKMKTASTKGESSVSDAIKGPDRGFWTPIFVNWLMAGIPSLTAILMANYFLAYIETAAGFLAPVFLILFPCLLTIRMHKQNIAPLSNVGYMATWAYLIIGMGWSYFALFVNVYLIVTGASE